MASQPITNPTRPPITLMGGGAWSIPYVDGANAVQLLGNGSAGSLLVSNGPTAAPSWAIGAGLAAVLPVMVGASGVSNGAKGAAPQPLAGDQLKFLRGDATWAVIPLMSGASPGAPGIAGLVPAPAQGYQHRYLRGDGTWQIVAGTGTVISVGLTAPVQFVVSNSPVTVAGDIDLAWADASANTILAGPATGLPAAPVFRSLVVADIPGLPWNKITSGTPTTLAGYGITDGVATTAASVPNISAGLFSARPAAGTAGRVYLATDTLAFYRDNGTTWDTVFPALTGAVTNTAGSLAMSLSAGSITNAMLANMPALTIKGNSTAGSTAPQDLSVGTVAGMLPAFVGATGGSPGVKGLVPAPAAGEQTYFLRGDGTWVAGSGSVTSVGLALPAEFNVTGSPVTGSGTLTGAWASQGANLFFLSPNGSAGVPAFRAPVPADFGTPAGGNSFLVSDVTATAVSWAVPATAVGLLPAFTGATNVTNGTKGVVPAPVAGQEGNFLRGDGTWAVAGGSLSGSGTANQVAVWSGTSVLTGTSLLTTSGTVLIVAGQTRTDGLQVGAASYSSSQVLTTSNGYVRYTGAGGATFTLPLANAAGASHTIRMLVRNVGSGNLTVTTTGGDTIDGVASITLAPGQGVELCSDGSSAWDTN